MSDDFDLPFHADTPAQIEQRALEHRWRDAYEDVRDQAWELSADELRAAGWCFRLYAKIKAGLRALQTGCRS